MTLTEFLTARLDATEADVAREMSRAEAEGWDGWLRDALREVEAHRAIIDLAVLPQHQTFTSPWVDALLALASVYADHPDYRDEWRA